MSNLVLYNTWQGTAKWYANSTIPKGWMKKVPTIAHLNFEMSALERSLVFTRMLILTHGAGASLVFRNSGGDKDYLSLRNVHRLKMAPKYFFDDGAQITLAACGAGRGINGEGLMIEIGRRLLNGSSGTLIASNQNNENSSESDLTLRMSGKGVWKSVTFNRVGEVTQTKNFRYLEASRLSRVIGDIRAVLSRYSGSPDYKKLKRMLVDVYADYGRLNLRDYKALRYCCYKVMDLAKAMFSANWFWLPASVIEWKSVPPGA